MSLKYIEQKWSKYKALRYSREYYFPSVMKKNPVLFFAYDYLNNLVEYLVNLCKDII